MKSKSYISSLLLIWLIVSLGCSNQKSAKSAFDFKSQASQKLGAKYSYKYNPGKTMVICWNGSGEMHDYLILNLDDEAVIYEKARFRGMINWESDSVIKIRRITGIPSGNFDGGGITYYDLVNQVNVNVNMLEEK